ncbi:MAG: hypothetical protein JOY60_12750 [Burkholderiaceae bacterium]|nr:hypothetical protein [Burkholderiaceae bacterium]
MTLNPTPIFPAAGSYVLRLHRDSRPELGQLMGRIEHVVSGNSADFATGTELLAWLIEQKRAQIAPGEPSQEGG